jgi:hypothetical protein
MDVFGIHPTFHLPFCLLLLPSTWRRVVIQINSSLVQGILTIQLYYLYRKWWESAQYYYKNCVGDEAQKLLGPAVDITNNCLLCHSPIVCTV